MADSPTKPGERAAQPVPAPATVVGRCVLAGLGGVVTSIFIVVWAQRHVPVGGQVVLGVLGGMAAVLGALPWRLLHRAMDRSEIRRLIITLRRVNLDERRDQIAALRLERDDDIGELAAVLYEILAHAAAQQLEANRIRRTLDASVRKETDKATGKLQREAATDPLTGLGNRRALSEQLGAHSGSQRQVCVLVLDIDRFKQVNDRKGHDAGDKCLAFLGRLLRSGLRGDDAAFRIGGDEFVVLMPGQAAEVGETVARRIDSLFRQMPWLYDDLERPTLSIGVAAAAPAKLSEVEELVRRADEAMYAAKRAGRGQVRNYNGLCAA